MVDWARDAEGKIIEAKDTRVPSNVVPIREDIDPDEPAHFERGDQAELASATLAQLGPNPITYDAGEFWRYSPSRGIWELLSGPLFRSTAEAFAGSPVGFGDRQKRLLVSAATTRGAEEIARDRIEATRNRVTFDGAPAGIAFTNGFVTVIGGKVSLLPHSPDHRARHAYDFDFAPTKPMPLSTEFFDELFADVGEDERNARIALLQEFFGASLIGEATRYQSALFLFGEGCNGKSECLRVGRGVFPFEAVVSVPPQRWGERFRLAQLEGKLANFVDEVPEQEILSGDAFKSVITGEPSTGERKHRDPFNFRPRAGHIFSTNSPISTIDHTDGFWRRVVVVPFTRVFSESPDRRFEAGADILAAELPQLVAWVIEGAARAQRQGGYTLPEKSRTLAAEWRKNADPVRIFLSARPPAEEIRGAQLFEQFKTWANENKFSQMSVQKFGRRAKGSGLYDVTEDKWGVMYKRRPEPTRP